MCEVNRTVIDNSYIEPPYILFSPQTCRCLWSKNFSVGTFFKSVEMSGFLTIYYVIKAFAYFKSTANMKTVFLVLFKEMSSSSSLSEYKK